MIFPSSYQFQAATLGNMKEIKKLRLYCSTGCKPNCWATFVFVSFFLFFCSLFCIYRSRRLNLNLFALFPLRFDIVWLSWGFCIRFESIFMAEIDKRRSLSLSHLKFSKKIQKHSLVKDQQMKSLKLIELLLSLHSSKKKKHRKAKVL